MGVSAYDEDEIVGKLQATVLIPTFVSEAEGLLFVLRFDGLKMSVLGRARVGWEVIPEKLLR